jgi:hypothetical protein
MEFCEFKGETKWLRSLDKKQRGAIHQYLNAHPELKICAHTRKFDRNTHHAEKIEYCEVNGSIYTGKRDEYVDMLLCREGTKPEFNTIRCLRAELISDSERHRLIQAIMHNKTRDVKLFLEDGDDSNMRCADIHDHVNPPLVYALKTKNYDICRLLLDHGADIHAKVSMFSDTVLRSCYRYNDIEAAKLLLEYK